MSAAPTWAAERVVETRALDISSWSVLNESMVSYWMLIIVVRVPRVLEVEVPWTEAVARE
jgi:hypothetical protein